MEVILRKKLIRKIFLILAGVIISWGFIKRMDKALGASPGGDHSTHVRAIYDLIAGNNPYEWTVATFENLDKNPNDKGYAYFPGILYVYTALYALSMFCQSNLGLISAWCSSGFLFLLPGVITSTGISMFLLLYFYKEKKDYLAMLFSVAFWSFNFFLLARGSLYGFDAVPIFLTLIALHFLERDDVLTGFFFALAVLFKTFPIILFPLFIFRSKKPVKFLLAGFVTALFFSIPFMRSPLDFWTYLRGALFVHGDRFVQGRPYLYYISYYFSIEFFRIIPFSFYSLASIFSGWILVGANKLLKVFKKPFYLRDKYTIAVLPFLSFYILTPVLNRTYLLWGAPVLLLGSYNFFKRRNKLFLFYIVNAAYWIFSYWYLRQWKEGFHIWHPT